MTPVLKQVSDDALHLPAQDRARLAPLLIVSIDDEDEADVSAAWDAELGKRVQEIREGKVKGVPAEEVFARAVAHCSRKPGYWKERLRNNPPA